MRTIDQKSLLTHIAVLFCFFLITMAYCYPLLEGNRISQPDNIQGRGMSHELREYHKETGGTALWTNSMFSGMPGFLIWMAYPSDPLLSIHHIVKRWIPDPANKIFLLMALSFFLLRVLEVPILLSAIGAVALTFPSYNFIYLAAGHSTKMSALAYMFGVLGGVFMTYRKDMWLGGLSVALLMALQIRSNHYQITYYLLMVLLVLFLVLLIDAIKYKTLPSFVKRSLVLGAAFLMGVGINIAPIWTTQEYTKATIRGGKSELTSNKEHNTGGLDKEYALRWSYGIEESFTLLIPNFYGGNSGKFFYSDQDSESLKVLQRHTNPQEANQLARATSHYWGDMPFTSGPAYLGAILVFLFVFGIYIVKGRIRWWLLIVTVTFLMLSWGRHLMWFTDIFYSYLPMYNKFRAVSSMMFIVQMSMPLLGIMALKELIEGNISKERLMKALKISGGITGGLCALFILMPGILSFVNDSALGLPSWFSVALIEDRKALMVNDAIRSLIFIALGAGTVWAYANEKLNQRNFLLLLGVLILIDAWGINTRYLNKDNFVPKGQIENPVQPTQADLQIMKDPDPHYRVYNTTTDRFNEATTSYFHKSVGGYHAAKLRRYQEIIEQHHSKGNMKVFNMLNTKYFIVPGADKQPAAQLNPDALGNAWFVSEFKIVLNPDEEIAALNDFEPEKTAIIETRFESEVSGLSIGDKTASSISMSSYSPDIISYTANASGTQLAVFSEMYYQPGWNAYVDGQPAPHFRANYILRAMQVPAGQHQIEFRFEPRSYYMGLKIGYGFQFLLLLAIGAYVYMNFFRRSADSRENIQELSPEEPEAVSENDSED